jgi:hypothetical protein
MDNNELNESNSFPKKVVGKVVETAKMPVKVVENVIVDTTAILQESGELVTGKGLASGVFSLFLAFLCFLGVLAFHYPPQNYAMNIM